MLYENILVLCKKKGITVSHLEKTLGFGNSTIKKWETCSPKVENVKAVADFFGVKIDRLLKEVTKDA